MAPLKSVKVNFHASRATLQIKSLKKKQQAQDYENQIQKVLFHFLYKSTYDRNIAFQRSNDSAASLHHFK